MCEHTDRRGRTNETTTMQLIVKKYANLWITEPCHNVSDVIVIAMSNSEQNQNAKAASGVLYSIILRLLSFTLTQLTIRFVDPTTLGKASIRLELICSTTVLFLGREGFRLGLLRVAHDVKSTKIDNICWMSVPVSLVFTTLALFYHLNTYVDQVPSGNANELDDYRLAGILYCIGSAIEICSEPYMIECLRSMDVKTRAKAEGLGSIGKALACVLLLKFYDRPYNSASFGFAQCVYAIIVCFFLCTSKWKDVRFPSWTTTFDSQVLWICTIFSLQSIFKHLLTDGDRIVLSAIAGAYDSGVYAMASAYGGIASRLIFQPLEENGRILFSNKHAKIQKLKAEKDNGADELLHELESTYSLSIILVVYIGLVFAVFGSNFTSILLKILAGEKWGSNTEAASALSSFCIYTSLMALNGMTEAFVYGVAQSGKEVGSLALVHGLIGVVFYILAPILVVQGSFTQLKGTNGLIFANGVCMGLRSMYSIHFAWSYFQRQYVSRHISRNSSITKFVLKILPHRLTCGAFIGSYFILKYSKATFLHGNQHLLSPETFYHISVGILCLIFVACVTYVKDKEYGREVIAMVSGRRAKKAKSD